MLLVLPPPNWDKPASFATHRIQKYKPQPMDLFVRDDHVEEDEDGKDAVDGIV